MFHCCVYGCLCMTWLKWLKWFENRATYFSIIYQQVYCPTDCGRAESQLRVEALCMGSDGIMNPDQHCATLPYPADVRCPATKSCVTFEWQAEQVTCPDECELPSSVILPDVKCVGSDGEIYAAHNCHDFPRPRVECPATGISVCLCIYILL